MNNTMTYQEALSWASSCIEGKNVDQNAPQFIIMMLMIGPRLIGY